MRYILQEDVLLSYNELYEDDFEFESIDKKNIICEKNAVLLSRRYMMSQLTINELLYQVVYVKKSEFDIMWKYYKQIAIKNNLQPTVSNGNLIFNKSFSKYIKSTDGRFVLEG